jgi:HAD superfamily phosphoserine phosphatase-like hydrolase
MPQVHAFFDFDDTLLDGDSILYWLRFYYGKRPTRRVFQILNWAGLVLFVLRLVDSHTLKRIYLYPMSLEHPEVLDQLAAEFVQKDLARHLHAPVVQRLWTHHLLGHKIVIISASATFYLRHLKLFFPMAEILGSELIWPKAGSFSLPKYRDGNLRGENKILRLKALGYGEAGALSFAYSDHEHDRFLLAFSEFPICVRPTPKLRRLAAAKGWPVMDWDDKDRMLVGEKTEKAGYADTADKANKVEKKSAAPHWRVRLQKLRLLILSAGAGPAPTGCDPLKEAATAREYAPMHCRILRERVLLHHSESEQIAKLNSIFARSV